MFLFQIVQIVVLAIIRIVSFQKIVRFPGPRPQGIVRFPGSRPQVPRKVLCVYACKWERQVNTT